MQNPHEQEISSVNLRQRLRQRADVTPTIAERGAAASYPPRQKMPAMEANHRRCHRQTTTQLRASRYQGRRSVELEAGYHAGRRAETDLPWFEANLLSGHGCTMLKPTPPRLMAA